jgi:hypothetical protein
MGAKGYFAESLVFPKVSELAEMQRASQSSCRPDVPKWLADLGLHPGHYYTGAKPKLRAGPACGPH